LIVVETAGTLAFALSGLIEAARKRLDAVGVCFVAGLTAFGGGTIRDVLLDRRPFFWVAHAGWLWALLVVCALVMLVLRARHLPPTERAMQGPDAFGLGLFAASGTQIARDASMPTIDAVQMGTVTAAFGGVLRDVVCNEIPRVFNDHRPYAVCAFAGGWLVVLAQSWGWPQPLGLAAGATLALALRLLSMAFDWKLPAWRQE
jgi:uncharacterized membrane protein YeiH